MGRENEPSPYVEIDALGNKLLGLEGITVLNPEWSVNDRPRCSVGHRGRTHWPCSVISASFGPRRLWVWPALVLSLIYRSPGESPCYFKAAKGKLLFLEKVTLWKQVAAELDTGNIRHVMPWSRPNWLVNLCFFLVSYFNLYIQILWAGSMWQINDMPQSRGNHWWLDIEKSYIRRILVHNYIWPWMTLMSNSRSLMLCFNPWSSLREADFWTCIYMYI